MDVESGVITIVGTILPRRQKSSKKETGMNSTTMEKPETQELTLDLLMKLMETDREAFLRKAGLLRPPKKSTIREDQIDFLENLYTVKAVPEIVPEVEVRGKNPEPKRSTNLKPCAACGDMLALLPREGKKDAYYEETILVGKAKRTLFWCEPCTDY